MNENDKKFLSEKLQSVNLQNENLCNDNLQNCSSLDEANFYMQLAIEQARKAAEIGEVPIGAVVVQNFVDNEPRIAAGNEPYIAAGNKPRSPRGNEPHIAAGNEPHSPRDNEQRIIASAHNLKETTNNPAGHAEFLSLQEAARKLGRWRLSDCTVFVTLEPCLMCAGFMHQARIERCVYGAPDPKAGALGTLYNVANDNRLNHNFDVQAGIMQEECAQLLKDFFRERRK